MLALEGAAITLFGAEESEDGEPSVVWKISARDSSGNTIVRSCSVALAEEDDEEEDDDEDGAEEEG